MKREEIEELLADYVNGELSATNRLKLEECFEQDLKLKDEAEWMLAMWHALDVTGEPIEPEAAMDDQLYAMLRRAKADQRKSGWIVTVNNYWLQAAAILLCALAFSLGRYTVNPTNPITYKTVYVKQLVPAQPQMTKPDPMVAKKAFVAMAPRKAIAAKDTLKDNSGLSQQLRSVYASERIGAVMKITGKGSLTDADLQRLELALREDPSPNVRLTILDALRPLATKPNVQATLISALNHQSEDLIKSSIVDLLIDNKSKQAIPQMIALLDDKGTNPILQSKIKAGIQSFLN